MQLLDNCRETAHKYYGDLLMAAEKTLADSLLQVAEKSANSDEQRQYFEAIQQLGQRSGAMHAAFAHALGKNFQAFLDGIEQEKSIDDQLDVNNLTLVNRDELEDELAISVIVSKSNSRNSELLWKLNRRMAVLRGGKAVTDETNPFGPAIVCDAIQDAVKELEVDNKARILIYKHIGKVFVISFKKILEQLNELFIEQGVLPNLRFEVSKDSSGAAPMPAAEEGMEDNAQLADDSTEAGSSPYRETATSIANQHQMFQAIRALQNSIGPRTHTAGGVSWSGVPTDGTGGADSFRGIDYALVLSAIQQSRDILASLGTGRPLSIDKVEKQLVQELAAKADPESQHKITRDDADTVDLVGMIFRYMLDDKNLDDSVKSLLSHLHTPYLKLALLDSKFLDNYEHSARLLLNMMAEVGGRWVKDEHDRTVLPKLKSLVDTILKGFVDDATIFDRLLEDFTRFKDGLEKRAKMVEKRNTEAQQGLEKLEVSKQRALDEILSRLDDKQVPDKIADILEKPWAEFLSFNLLRHGDQSLTWQSALKVVDGVIWSVIPEESGMNKESFKRHQSDVESSVKEGLATIGYDQEASKSLLKSLKEAQELAYHSLVMEDVKSPPAADGKPAASQSTSAAKPKATPKVARKTRRKPVKPAPEKLTAEEQEMVEKLKDIAFGTWFEFQGNRGEKDIRQLKLAWFSRVTNHYMFVDHSGVKQAVETHTGLAKGMCEGRIRLASFEKRSFMERAFGAILDRLKIAA